MSGEPDASPPDASRLRTPLARLLRPLVRLLIRSGVTFPAICNLLRELYVNVAENDFALARKEQTDSRVSLLTGIHRKEVSRLRGAGAPLNAVPVALSQTSRIMARWLAGPPFGDASGQPIDLPRIADKGKPSFESLVASVTRDVRPRAVLDDWLDRKLVAIGPDDAIVLLRAGHVPQAGSDQQLYYFGRNIHDHMAAAVANVLAEGPPFLERAVHYDGLSGDLARHLERRSREVALAALQTLNIEAHAACATDPGGTARWNFGLYVMIEDKTPSPEPTPPPAASRREQRR
ncbi:DUF6502 family protein [Lichenihabitans psoromatis]|uniref:DUF6502 family protein n=1 Tax=Lichenihabitans psoromatis TaxID=2528642 RepID=UPI001FDF3134|nr:DUF6502 family protein [Lichenihabitans psoromatis]